MRIAILVLGCLCSGLLHAGPMRMAVLPGGGLVFKQIESMRERRFSNLVEQRTDFSCGAAAVATILRQAYRFDVDEEQVITGMLAGADHDLVRTQGFSMLDMKRYIQALGMRARGYRIPPAALGELKVPVIVLQEVRGYKHFVVLQRVQNGWAYVGDPVLGHKRYALDEFAEGWNGIVFAIIGPEYDRYNALLSPPEPLTARDRLNGFRPVKDAELMEYGFIQSDFF